MPSYKFYGDESGNTGGGFLDPEQPIFVLSLIGWPAAREAEILLEYKKACLLHGRPQPTDLHPPPPDGRPSRENKAEALLTSHSGKQFCAALMDIIARLNIQCVFGISEKKFLLTAMFVETFLDPTYNTLAPTQNSPLLRQKIAREIHKSSDDSLLKYFSQATKDDDSTALEQIGILTAERLQSSNDPEIAHFAKAISQGASNTFRFGQKDADAPKKANRPHPGIHTLFATILTLEQNLIKTNSDAHVIIDEEGSWDNVKQYAFNTHSKSSAFLDEIGYGAIEKVNSLTFIDSKQHFAIQMADILSGLLMRGCRSWLKGEKNFSSEDVYRKAGNILGSFESKSFVALNNRASVLGWVKD